MTQERLKVLVVSRDVWNEPSANTLNDLFNSEGKYELSHIYIETKKPNNSLCHSFFQISEYSLITKIFKWGTKTGQKIDTNYISNESIANKEASTMDFVRHHRRYIYTVLREILWLFNGWKTKELREYIKEVNPDVIWFMGSPLILMNRLMRYIVKVSKKPYCIFEMDDVYNYSIHGVKPLERIYRYFLRANVRKLMKGVSQLFVISPKMKEEYDKAFHLNSMILTRGIDFSAVTYQPYQPHSPVQMVYMGQVIYDRITTIEMIGRVLDEINDGKKKIVLSVYTKNPVNEVVKAKMIKNGSVLFCDPVPYTEVKNILSQNDVVLFVESFDKEYKRLVRLSFSTKITDCLGSGKCVLAVGPSDIAPIEYFKDNDAAFVASSEQELKGVLSKLLVVDNLKDYSRKAFSCAAKNHDKKVLDNVLFEKLTEVSSLS